ncbi:MAG: leucyl/phenylalanyl-tRNA--protein transferase, partial [Chitinophagaceae bacterium]
MHILSEAIYFPPIEEADEEGLLAIGGDLSAERLLLAYRQGIFPWYSEDDPICWWSPHPRFVLFPNELKVSKSMQQVINRKIFEFRINNNFEAVITNCQNIYRSGQQGTWISDEMKAAYIQLHKLGYAHSAEAW